MASPGTAAVATPSRDAVLGPIARRQRLVERRPFSLGAREFAPLRFDVGRLAVLARLGLWLATALRLAGVLLADRVRGRSTATSRARRWREAMEQVGGTFVKLGQQVAMRIDLLPWEYSVEFSKMLDQMPAFPLDHALRAVERSVGRPWQEVFETFDPEPIGSASVACVYQARLHNGDRVAVKVRRPGIGEAFMADCRVLDLLLGAVERLALVRPGFTGHLRDEIRDTLLEELDFRREAQFQHLFRHNARHRARRRFFTAPRVYFEQSNDEVLVQEFVTGMWLWEVIATVERGEPAGLAMMQEMRIDPALVARRLLWAAFWSLDENLFFHADPHPANLLIGRDSTITFIDFGSCGSFDNEQRWAAERVAACMKSDDVEGMARATMKLMEPLPPVDLPAIVREAQAEFVRVLSTFRTKAKHTEWWERTSARLWLAIVKIARQRNVPLSIGTLRMMRATLLYDTLVLRLDRTADRYERYDRFRHDRAVFARKRWHARTRLGREQFFLRADEWLETADHLVDRAQHALSAPAVGFHAIVEKWVFAFAALNRFAWRAILLTLAATGVAAGDAFVRAGTVDLLGAFGRGTSSPAYRLTLAVLAALLVRQILARSKDRDV